MVHLLQRCEAIAGDISELLSVAGDQDPAVGAFDEANLRTWQKLGYRLGRFTDGSLNRDRRNDDMAAAGVGVADPAVNTANLLVRGKLLPTMLR